MQRTTGWKSGKSGVVGGSVELWVTQIGRRGFWSFDRSAGRLGLQISWCSERGVDLCSWSGQVRTKNCCTNPSILLSICVFSLSETALGGVNRLNASSPFFSTPKSALSITQHQKGTVLLSASGILFPLLVESTITHPPCWLTTSSSCKLSLRRLNAHSPMWPSVLLK